MLQEQSQLTSAEHMRGVNIGSLAAIEQTRMLANTLAQNDDPKFQVYMLHHNSTVFRLFLAQHLVLWGTH